MRIKDGFVLRTVGGNHMVVPVGVQTVDFRCIITLNETGATLWKRLQQEQDEEQLVTALLEEYDVSAEVAAADVARFVESLRQANLLV